MERTVEARIERISKRLKDRDLDNIRQEFEQLEQLNLDIPLRAKFLYLHSHYFRILGEYDRVISVCKRGLEFCLEHGIREIAADFYITSANNYWDYGKYEQGRKIADEGLQFLEGNRDIEEQERREGSLLNSMGILNWSLGDFDTALFNFEESIKRSQKCNDMKGMANSYTNMGILCSIKGELHTALIFYERSIEIARELDDPQKVANASVNMGNTYYHLGRFLESLEHHNVALEIYQQLDHKQNIAASLHNIGNVLNAQGRIEEALEYYEHSLGLKRQLGNQQHIAYTLHTIGVVRLRQNNFEDGKVYLNEALRIKEEIGNPTDTSSSLFHIIILDIDQDERYAAQKTLHKFKLLLDNCQEPLVSKRYRACQAYFNKTFLFEAEEIISEFCSIADSEIQDHALIVFAIINLVEVLIQSLDEVNQIDLLPQITDRLAKLKEIAQNQKSYLLFIDTLILQSRLNMILMEFDQARNNINTALRLATDHQLLRYITMLEDEIKQMKSQMERILLLAETAPTLQLLVNEVEILDIIENRLLGNGGSWGGLM